MILIQLIMTKNYNDKRYQAILNLANNDSKKK